MVAAGRPRSPARRRDLSRLTAHQLTRLELLSEWYAAVGMAGLTDAEVDEVAELLALLEEHPAP
jgi:hypothetical protein